MKIIIKLGAALLMLLSAGFAQAELVLESGHVRALLPGATSTAAYMTLKNSGTADVIITGVSSPAAGHVSIHSTMNHDGMMHMMAMENLTVPAGKSLILAAGGLHLMLEEPKAAFAVNDKVELTLQFADGKRQSISLPVQSVMSESP